jgi:transcriptional regulator NrdR family protein
MICPVCKNINSPKKVLRTWVVKNGTVKRKRKCAHCKNEYHTMELVVIRQNVLMCPETVCSEQYLSVLRDTI